MDTQERIDEGEPPDKARLAARRDFGNVWRVVEDTRAAWGWTGVEQFLQDLRLALRLLAKDRAFTLTTTLTLALCIGINTSIFTVVRSVVLRPLPYFESDRLVTVFDAFPGAGVERAGASVPNYVDHQAMTDVFDSQALYQFGRLRVGQGVSAEAVASMNVTPSFFHVLRASAVRGRLFTQEEGLVGADRVAVVSYRFAQRHAGGPDAMVGRLLRLGDAPHTVVGVLPEAFTFLDPDVSVWVPLAFTAEERADDTRFSENHEEIGRLAAGVTLARAQARVDALNTRIVERAGPLKSALLTARYHTRLVSFEADLVRQVRASLELLWGGALLIMLIAAVNITNLSMARGTSRLRELATRHALGAARGRVTRQLLTETTVVAMVGGLLGLLLGSWSLDALSSIGLGEIPRAHEIGMDGVVVALACGLALALGLVIGAVPAMQAAQTELGIVLRDDSRTATGGSRARHLRRGLVTAQLGLAFMLLVGAGLLLASFREVLAVEPGFDAKHVLTGRVTPPSATSADRKALDSYTHRSLERIRALPGVAAAGASSYLPFSWDSTYGAVLPEGYTPARGEAVSPHQLHVTPGYLEALRVPVKRGRLFTDSDTPHAAPVVIVDELLAKRFWPASDPIGRRVFIPRRPEDLIHPGPDTVWMQVVGVVGSVKLRALVEGEEARIGAYYLPYAQEPSSNIGFAIRMNDSAGSSTVIAAVRRVLAEVDPEAPLFDVVTMSDRIDRSLNARKALMVLSVVFGALALLLSMIGIHGLLAYHVGQRTRELGIRIALGSDTSGILRLVLREAVLLMFVGIAAGTAGAVALRGLVASQLYGIAPFDPRVTLAAIGVLTIVGFVACLGPARRAARINPVLALQR